MRPLVIVTTLCLVCGPALPSRAEAEEGPAAGDSLGAAADSMWQAADSVVAAPDSVPSGGPGYAPADSALLGASISGLRRLYALDYASAGREENLEFVSSEPAEALFMDAGLRYITRGLYGGPRFISMRGRDPRATGFQLDGVPLTDPQVEVFDPHWLPIEGTERVEALKGPATALFGGGATGGLLNVVSHDVLLPVPLTRVNVWFGSFDTRLVGASFMRSVGRDFGFMGAYDYFSTAGFADGAGYKMEKLYGKLSARFPSSLKFDVTAYRHVGDTGVLGEDFTSRLDSRTFLDLSFEVGRESVFDLDLYHFDVTETFRGGPEETYDASLFGVGLDWKRGGEGADRRLGTRFERKNTTDAGGITEGSVFGEFACAWKNLAGEAVLRAEKNSEHDFQYAVSLPVSYAVGERLDVFGRVERGFSYPPARRAPGGDEVEVTRGISGGILCDCNVIQVSLNVFYYDVTGAILYRTDDSCRISPIEGAAFDMLGGEAQVRLPPWHGLEAVVAWSRSGGGRDIEGAGDVQPADVLAWGLRYRLRFTRHIRSGVTFAGRWSSSISLGHRRSCIDEECTETECVSDAGLPAVRSAMLYAFLAIDDARAFFRVRNLFNETIPIGWDRPGLPARSYEFGLAWDLHD